MPRTPGSGETFGDQFTVFPDRGVTELHCYICGRDWEVGYHPSLDVLIEQAAKHNTKVHMWPGRQAVKPAAP